MSQSVDVRIGTQLAGFRIEALIGRGGMGVVYRAEQLRYGRKVALKILAPELSADDSFRERFEQEWRTAARIEHPNIVPIYEADESDGVLYIAMRYVEGTDLGSLLATEGRLEPQQAFPVLEQVARALDAAHSNELVHRDVKPGNILIAAGSPLEEAHVYLTDFGIAKQARTRSGLTRTGFFVGTIDYAAPEQIEGKALDGAADIYALGCVLYHCLTGSLPYEKDSEVAMLYAHLLEPPPHLSVSRPDLPPELDEVIETALAKARDDRYPTARAMIAAARAAVRLEPGTGVVVPTAGTPTMVDDAVIAVAAGTVLVPDGETSVPTASAAPETVLVPPASEVDEEEVVEAGPSGPAPATTVAPEPPAETGEEVLATVVSAEALVDEQASTRVEDTSVPAEEVSEDSEPQPSEPTLDDDEDEDVAVTVIEPAGATVLQEAEEVAAAGTVVAAGAAAVDQVSSGGAVAPPAEADDAALPADDGGPREPAGPGRPPAAQPSRRRLVIALGGAAALIAAGVIVAVLVLGGGGGTKKANGTTAPATSAPTSSSTTRPATTSGGPTTATTTNPTTTSPVTTNPQATFTAAEQRLYGEVPSSIRPCTAQSGSSANVVAKLSCGSGGPVEATYARYRTLASLMAAYGGQASDVNAPSDAGTCGSLAKASVRYTNQSGKELGSLLCYRAGGRARVAWTDERKRILVLAHRTDSARLADLLGWWTALGAYKQVKPASPPPPVTTTQQTPPPSNNRPPSSGGGGTEHGGGQA